MNAIAKINSNHISNEAARSASTDEAIAAADAHTRAAGLPSYPELQEAQRRISDGQVMDRSKPFTALQVVESYRRIASQALISPAPDRRIG